MRIHILHDFLSPSSYDFLLALSYIRRDLCKSLTRVAPQATLPLKLLPDRCDGLAFCDLLVASQKFCIHAAGSANDYAVMHFRDRRASVEIEHVVWVERQ